MGVKRIGMVQIETGPTDYQHPNIEPRVGASLALAAADEPWAGKWHFSEEGLRSLARALSTMADEVHARNEVRP